MTRVLIPPVRSQVDLNARLLDSLRPVMEEWAGDVALANSQAYGVRVYRNSSTLVLLPLF